MRAAAPPAAAGAPPCCRPRRSPLPALGPPPPGAASVVRRHAHGGADSRRRDLFVGRERRGRAGPPHGCASRLSAAACAHASARPLPAAAAGGHLHPASGWRAGLGSRRRGPPRRRLHPRGARCLQRASSGRSRGRRARASPAMPTPPAACTCPRRLARLCSCPRVRGAVAGAALGLHGGMLLLSAALRSRPVLHTTRTASLIARLPSHRLCRRAQATATRAC